MGRRSRARGNATTPPQAASSGPVAREALSARDMTELQSLLGPLLGSFEVVGIKERPVTRRSTTILRAPFDDRAGRSAYQFADGGEASAGALQFADEAELGRDGLWWLAGLPHKDRNPRFAPVVARGSKYDHGDYYQLFISDSDYRRGVEDRAASLSCGTWRVELPKRCEELPGYARRVAERQRDYVEERLDLESQSWIDHVHDALYQTVSGFALFEKVWRRDGSCKLSFRWPHTVDEWILDEHERDWVAAKLDGQAELLPRARALHYRYGSFGMDPEGLPPMRSVAMLIELKQQLLRLTGVTAGAYGVPWLFVEQTQQNADTRDDARIIGALSRAQATQRPVFQLKWGAHVVMLSPQGQMPNFLDQIRYCDEKISQLLNAEGALLGQRGVGSLALADQRDSERLSSAYHWGDRIARTISEQVIREMITRAGWLPVAPGCWPRLVFDLGMEDDKIVMSDLVAGVGAGLILPTEEVVMQMHERLDLDTAGVAAAFAERKARAEAMPTPGAQDGGKVGDESKPKEKTEGE
jgi:hypothetical protein